MTVNESHDGIYASIMTQFLGSHLLVAFDKLISPLCFVIFSLMMSRVRHELKEQQNPLSGQRREVLGRSDRCFKSQ